jgi:hypothetical protein
MRRNVPRRRLAFQFRQLVNWSNGQSVNWSIGQRVNRPTGHPVNPPID